MWLRSAWLAIFLLACAARREAVPGISTAPRSAPDEVQASSTDDAGSPDITAEAPAASDPTPGRLHAITGMSLGPTKLDPKVVLAQIEAKPDALAVCSALASAEPNAPDGSWNGHLTIRRGVVSLAVESPVQPAFQDCLVNAATGWKLQNTGDGEMMLLFGLAR